MRILPDNPNVDFLRRQAKELLVALRESNPTASLTDAQRALANQYGFESWAALRVEVEQQRRQPPTAPAGLAQGLAEAFGLGAVTEMQPVSFTPMGRVWSLDTEAGRWLAVPGYPWMGEQRAEIGARLQAAAVGAGVRAPTPRRSGAGHLVETVAETPWRINDWVDLGPMPLLPVNSTVARRIGEVVGTLHGLGIPSDEAINPYLTSRRPDDAWNELLCRARTARRPWADRLAELLPAYADLAGIGTTTPTDDLILCNCNLIPDHVRLGTADAPIVVEWTFAGSLTAELEVAALLSQWVLRPVLNAVVARAFAEGYADRMGGFPRLTLDSFGVAISGYLNWAYNAFCEAMIPPDRDGASFAERETADLLDHPLTPSLLRQLVDVTRG